ncbi:hypothetical protein [Flavobacterium sp.]|jgi:SNF family Na+-dependent transporter|uniref:hypothetical protein n=1 Tax=Flavobacterium sp. TaxID=239 RepID=UPI0025EAE96D|nr:hypothetical protein [Flavobacterium sp.]
MKLIQDENIYVLIIIIFFNILLIWWTRKREIKENNKLEEIDSVSKMYKWRIYLISGTIIIILISEILKRFNKI